MAKIAIAYGTTEGQTRRISEYIAEEIRKRNQQAEAVNIRELPRGFALEDYDGTLVGASIHMGEHEDSVKNFARENRESLERIPSAFFSVSLTARDETEEARSHTEEYVEKFVEETGWRPDKVGIVAGALLYTHYGFIKRRLMKKISQDMGSADTDTARDYEYTDWGGVRRFAEDFLEACARTPSMEGTS